MLARRAFINALHRSPLRRPALQLSSCQRGPNDRCLASRSGTSTAAQASSAGSMAAGAHLIEPQEGPLVIHRVPCLSDNYSWLVHDPASGDTAVVDPAEPGPVVAVLHRQGWKLTHIWNTHHHSDHTGANGPLKVRHEGLRIIGPRADRDRIPGIDEEVGDGDTFTFGGHEVRVFDTPGHTRGHIAFWVPGAKALFPGDTLFALGCGRLFEGTPEQMWTSLSKLTPLPDDTRVFCAHEYTQSNARFAVVVDPSNEALAARKQQIDEARAKFQPTVPSLLGEEKATNPFIRPHDPAIRKQLGLGPEVPDWQVFGAVRKAKDEFRG